MAGEYKLRWTPRNRELFPQFSTAQRWQIKFNIYTFCILQRDDDFQAWVGMARYKIEVERLLY